eukprot:TRINITY_DN32856_c0_g1_i2.p1 TRINITY_DN32856_c0_g1~~TRINITY_DN32856_c0_g1_i2.p1  ORF type:complete len:254 (-),score=40.94 TRINITY_DN32856_c0_g1_i2:100-861(-)
MSRSEFASPLELPCDGPCANHRGTHDAASADLLALSDELKSNGLLGRTRLSGSAYPLKAKVWGGVNSSELLDSHANAPAAEGVAADLKVATPPHMRPQQPHCHAPQHASLEVLDTDWASLLVQSSGSAMAKQEEHDAAETLEPPSSTTPCTPRAKEELTEPPKHDKSRWTDDIDERLKQGSLSADDFYLEYSIALHRIVYDPSKHSPLTHAIRALRGGVYSTHMVLLHLMWSSRSKGRRDAAPGRLPRDFDRG